MLIDRNLTIVIPVYNRADTVGRTLASIDAQTMRPAAVVLVDNASADASLSILHTWAAGKPYVTVVSEPTPGACAARNRGLTLVTTPFVMFFDSDDVMLPHHVADFSAAIDRHPDVDIFGRDIWLVTLRGKRRLYFSARDTMFHNLFRGAMSSERFVARTELLRSVGGWNESLRGWDDLELGVRLLLTRPLTATVPGPPGSLTYETPNSITGTSFSAHPERWEPSLEAIRRDVTEAGRTDLLRWVDARAMILAARYAAEGRRDLADPLRTRILARTATPLRQQLIYLHNLHLSRLTWLLARMIL